MSIARYYDAEKNPEGAYWAGIPLANLSEEFYNGLTKDEQAQVDSAPFYRKTKPTVAKSTTRAAAPSKSTTKTAAAKSTSTAKANTQRARTAPAKAVTPVEPIEPVVAPQDVQAPLQASVETQEEAANG